MTAIGKFSQGVQVGEFVATDGAIFLSNMVNDLRNHNEGAGGEERRK